MQYLVLLLHEMQAMLVDCSVEQSREESKREMDHEWNKR